MRLLAILITAMGIARSAMAEAPVLLVDPMAPLEQAWTHQRFSGATEYERVELNGVAAIRAIGRQSASGLYREVSYLVVDHPWLEWSWRVDRLQKTADLRVKSQEDFGAVIFLIFGHLGLLNRDVPTLAYAWTNDRLSVGTIVDSPHHPASLRTIVVRSGAAGLGQWMPERRNVAADFRTAFGREPPDTVELVALFTDNDQTREPVEAYYGAARALSD